MILKIKTPALKMIVGLGNPGPAFQNTYHNAGYLFLNWLKKNTTDNDNLIIIKSDFFMNESGRAVKTAIQKFKIKPAALLVVHDDSDIAFGNFKLSFGRNSAGHRGVESIIQNLKTKNFWRLRIGVRKKTSEDKQEAGLPAEVRQRRPKAGEFVLKKIKPAELKILEKVFEKALLLLKIKTHQKTDGIVAAIRNAC